MNLQPLELVGLILMASGIAAIVLAVLAIAMGAINLHQHQRRLGEAWARIALNAGLTSNALLAIASILRP